VQVDYNTNICLCIIFFVNRIFYTYTIDFDPVLYSYRFQTSINIVFFSVNIFQLYLFFIIDPLTTWHSSLSPKTSFAIIFLGTYPVDSPNDIKGLIFFHSMIQHLIHLIYLFVQHINILMLFLNKMMVK